MKTKQTQCFGYAIYSYSIDHRKSQFFASTFPILTAYYSIALIAGPFLYSFLDIGRLYAFGKTHDPQEKSYVATRDRSLFT